MRRSALVIIVLIILIVATLVKREYVNTNKQIISKNIPGCIPGHYDTANSYLANKWYRDSAEKNAIYNEIFSLALDKIRAQVKQDRLKKHKWGVVFDIDETLLDNSLYEKQNQLSCVKFSESSFLDFVDLAVSVATPGASRITCTIRHMGGEVILVTNRNGNYDSKIKQATIDNLNKTGICFDNVLFAARNHDDDKNARFKAINTGDYNGIVALHSMPPVNVIAYFGDNIQDFPHIYQADAIKNDPNSDFFKQFGTRFFNLPNPVYGSWMGNKFN